MADTTNTVPGNIPAAIYNHDIIGIVQRLQRFVAEMAGSSSSGVSIMSDADQKRLQSYLDAISNYEQWVTTAPVLDLPETNRLMWPVAALVGIPNVENDSIQDLLRLFHVTCVELLNSQSARLPCNLMPADAARFTALVTKIKNLLTNYIQKSDPLDLPASSPEVPMSPQGKVGV